MSKLNKQGLTTLVDEINKSINTKINASVKSGIDTSNFVTKDELNGINSKIENLKASEIAIDDTDNLFTHSDIEGALKEVMTKANDSLQQASDGKTKIAQAITGKGISASGGDTFDELVNKIGQISTGKRVVSGTAMPLGVTAFYYADGSGNFESFLNFSIPLEEIGFRPSTLVATYTSGSVQLTTLIYSIGNFTTDFKDSNNSFTLTFESSPTDTISTVYHFKTRYWLSGDVISGNKIFVPIHYETISSPLGQEFKWIAFE